MNAKVLEHFKKDKYAEWLGISVDKVDQGYAEVSMELTENMRNFHGAANGGAIFSLADVAFACASNSHGQTAVGISMHMHYLKAGVINEKLKAVAREDTQPNRLGSYRIEVLNEQDELIAVAEGMVYRTKNRFVD